ncbi:hypothetical protein BH20VER3_BH20VER3_03300 [soil metagenome]
MMRTTLSLDDDVAAALRAARQRSKKPFKQIVNESLRRGLRPQVSRRQTSQFRTGSVKLGRCLVGSLDDVAEVLAIVEGESFS